MVRMPIGRLIQNTQRQFHCATMMPPTKGPSRRPMEFGQRLGTIVVDRGNHILVGRQQQRRIQGKDSRRQRPGQQTDGREHSHHGPAPWGTE